MNDMSKGGLGRRLSRDEQAMVPRFTDTDLLSFLDGQKGYVEWGGDRAVGSGFIRREEDGWLMKIIQKEGNLHSSLEHYGQEPVLFHTLRDALEAAVDWCNSNTPFLRAIDNPSMPEWREPTNVTCQKCGVKFCFGACAR